VTTLPALTVNENILLLRVTKEGNAREFYICAIYGPNRYEPAFFQDLRTLLADSGNKPVIIAGDWNCTVSNSVAAVNPDFINMNTLPNKRHSDLLMSLCDDLDLHDPFRTRYPNLIEYTYIPTDVTKKTRLRINFFIISKSLSTKVTECCIKKNLQNKLFDHKAISMSFVKKNGNVKIPVISKSILKDPETDLIVGLAVADCYLLYSAEFNEDELLRLRCGLGLAWQQLRAAGPGNYYAAPGDRTELEENTREATIANVREYLDFFPFARARDGVLNIEDNIFMECLMNSIKNETISYQIFVKKNSKKQKAVLMTQIENLKKLCRPDPNRS
jgi:hypothetical protein